MKSTIASLALFFAKTAYAGCEDDQTISDSCWTKPACVTAFKAYMAAGGSFKGANTDAIVAAGGQAYATCVESWKICAVPVRLCTCPDTDPACPDTDNAACKTAWEAYGDGYPSVSNYNLDKWDAIRTSGATGANVADCMEQQDKAPTACPFGAPRTSNFAVWVPCMAGVDDVCNAKLNKLPDSNGITKSDQAAVDASGCCANAKCRAVVKCLVDPAVITCVAPPSPPAASAGVASTAGGAAALIVAAVASLA